LLLTDDQIDSTQPGDTMSTACRLQYRHKRVPDSEKLRLSFPFSQYQYLINYSSTSVAGLSIGVVGQPWHHR